MVLQSVDGKRNETRFQPQDSDGVMQFLVYRMLMAPWMSGTELSSLLNILEMASTLPVQLRL